MNRLTDEEIVKAFEYCNKSLPHDKCLLAEQHKEDWVTCQSKCGRMIIDLIHRLQDENKALLKENEALSISFYGVQNQARERCNELQKQVDELKEERYYTEQDTAKEILDELDLFFKGTTFRKGYEFKKIDEKLKELKKRNGIEVE